MPYLSSRYRCIAPDLLGLGDTETASDADWSLPAQAEAVLSFLEALQISQTHVVAHDHGGAIAQLLASNHPDRMNRLLLSNVEAYDNWPSLRERPFVRLTQHGVLGPMVVWLYARRAIFRHTLVSAQAVVDGAVLTKELLDGYIRANLSTRHRRTKTKRFLAGQLVPDNNRTTLELLDRL